MLEKCKYVNHINEAIDFGQNGLFINENDLRNFSLSYDTYNNDSIANIRQEISKKKLPIVSVGSNAFANLDSIITISEKDIIDNVPGKLYIGDWYIEGYLIGASYKGYTRKKSVNADFSFVSISKQWKRPRIYSFRPSEQEGDDGMGYPYDYPYAYLSDINVMNIVNTFYAPANFKLVIFGVASNPQISIGGHMYKVLTDVEDGETLTVDSVEKTIYLTDLNGGITNKFAQRDTSSYIFEKIPSGSNALLVTGDLSFDITLYEERSTPIWT